MTKHGPGTENEKSNSKEYTEKQTLSRSFRGQNDGKMGTKGVGRKEEKRE